MSNNVDTIEVPDDSSGSSPVQQSTPLPDASTVLQDAVMSHAKEIIVDPALILLGYIVHERGKFLICTTCRLAVLPKIASGHAESHGLASFPQHKLTPYIKKFNLFEKSADFHTWALAQKPLYSFPDMELKRGYACAASSCNHYAGTEASLKTHWSKDHGGTPKYNLVWLQQIYLQSTYHKWLPVRETLATASASSMMDGWHALNDALPELKPGVPPALRELEPWLKKHRWLDLLKYQSSEVVAEFLQKAQNKTYQTLSTIIVRYAERAMEFLYRIPPSIRQALGSPTLEIRAGRSFNPPEADDVITRYSNLVAHLISTQHRLKTPGSSSIPCLLNDAQTIAIAELYRALSSYKPDADLDALDALLPPMQNVLMRLFIHQFSPKQCDIDQDPVYMWLIHHNWQSNGSFKKPGIITGDFAAVSWIARCTVLTEVYLKKEESNGTLDYHTTLDKLRAFIVIGSPSPLGHMLCIWSDLTYYRRGETTFPNFSWIDNQADRYVYRGAPGSVTGLRATVHEAMDTSQNVLENDILFGLDLGSLPTAIYDDPQNTDVGYSFLKDPRNHFSDGMDDFFRALSLSSDPSHKNFFYHKIGDTWVLNHGNCWKWINHCQEFLENFLVHSHMTHGQPTRGTEMLASTFENMPNYARTIIFSGNEGVNALPAGKTEYASGRRTITPHFNSLKGTQQLFIYLRFVRPVEIFLIRQLTKKTEIHDNYRSYLFTGPNGRWDTPKFTNILLKATRKHLL